MNDISKLFFELIKVSIGAIGCLGKTPTSDEWQTLYDKALKQSLVGICFAGVQKLQAQRQAPPEMLYLQWMGMAAKIQQRNEVLNSQCIELSMMLSKSRLEHCIMKGQQVGCYYEDLSALRSPRDIDVWVKGGMTNVVEFVQRIAPTKSISHQHVHLNIYDNTSVEIHYIPVELHCPWYNARLHDFLECNSCFIEKKLGGKGAIYAPSDVFNIVHLLAHSFRHLFGEGATMKQMLDVYFVLKDLMNVPSLRL